jgi:pantoate--beta-alanine ligase
MTKVIKTIAHWREERRQIKATRVGFVPTMGALHAGHQALVQRSLRENEVTVVSIFVNPTQFNDKADFEKYPRTDQTDIELLTALGVHYVFMPSATELYPDGYSIKISETDIAMLMEGKSRPGHFDGVLTVVMKLLSIIRPTACYMGEKDFQQYLLIKKLAEAFFLEVEIIPCATVRDADGLALSSRNALLSAEERLRAPQFPHILAAASTPEEATRQLQEKGFTVDYVQDMWGRRFGAVRLGKVRLIDNLVLGSTKLSA